MAKGPRVFPSEIWIGMGFLIGHFCESWHDMTQGQTWRRAGPFVISRVFNLFEEGDPPEREFLSLLSVLKTDLSLKNGKKQRFFLSRFWHSHKNFANLVDHFLKGQRSFCWFCCAHIKYTYQIFLIHPWYQLLMSPKTDLKKSPKQKKHQKVAKSFSDFFGTKTPSSPNFQQKNKKTGPNSDLDVFFCEVYLATNVWIFGAVPQVCSFVMDEFFFCKFSPDIGGFYGFRKSVEPSLCWKSCFFCESFNFV